jgi:flagellar assembly protein FliH
LSDASGDSGGSDFRPWQAPRVGAAATRHQQALADAEAEARQRGHEVGLAEGREAGQAELNASAERLEAVLRALTHPLETVDEQAERALVELACAVAGQLVRRQLHHHPDEIVPVVREAVTAMAADAGAVEIRLQPDDAAIVRESLAVAEGDHDWQVRDDPALSRGDCRVHAGHAWVDARLDQRIARIVNHVLGGERSRDAGATGPVGDPA